MFSRMLSISSCRLEAVGAAWKSSYLMPFASSASRKPISSWPNRSVMSCWCDTNPMRSGLSWATAAVAAAVVSAAATSNVLKSCLMMFLLLSSCTGSPYFHRPRRPGPFSRCRNPGAMADEPSSEKLSHGTSSRFTSWFSAIPSAQPGEAAPRIDKACTAPLETRTSRAPRTRRSLVPSRRKPLSETRLNRPRGLRVAPFGKIDAAPDI